MKQMPADVSAITSPTIIRISDGTVESDFDGGSQVLILSHCSGSSIRGLTLRRRGKVNRLYIRPDMDRDVTMYEGEQQILILIVEKKDINKMEFHYNIEDKRWAIKRRRSE